MKIIITLLAVCTLIGCTFTITRSIKDGADQRLQSQASIAAAFNKQVRLERDATEDYARYKQAAKEDHEFRRLTGQPDPIVVRIVK